MKLASLWLWFYKGIELPPTPPEPPTPYVFPGGVPLSRIHGVKPYYQKTRFELETREFLSESEIYLSGENSTSWALSDSLEASIIIDGESEASLTIESVNTISIASLIVSFGNIKVRFMYSVLQTKIESNFSLHTSGLLASVQEIIESTDKRRHREEEELLDEDD